jgi:ABC-type dipeptide/oligopeptide/nickel transport system permease subunit
LTLALLAVSLAALVGSVAGLTAGYLGGQFDALVMRFTDVINSLPGIMFMVIVVLISAILR